ncbi:helix-turn-helix transcriptional regulator [Kitasatospora sp. NPDC088391]|uniref:helix-turn-helix transcriptional regulator n=1 Tax=Kitasatospora sp. NPDC088391 TaxID=3364074 RepID=UPI003812A85A
MFTTSPYLVGRTAEQRVLLDGLIAARNGRGSAVFVGGEAGIGKTRLAADCAYRAVADGMAVLRGRGSSTGAPVPFRPVAEALLSLFRVSGPPQDDSLAPYRGALAALVPEWRGERRPGPAPSLTDIAEALLRLLAVVGRGEPDRPPRGCLLIVEDLHEADAETLAVLDYVVDNLAALPVLLVATLRQHPCPAQELALDAAAGRRALRLDLQPLDAARTAELAAACLSAAPEALPVRAVDRVVRDAAGNPFVVEELLSGMVTAGALRRDPEHGWQVFGDLGIEVPTTVVRSVVQRAARLDPVGRDMLNVAAVLGRRFALPVLQLVTGLDDRSLLIHLRAGIDARLLSPSGPVADRYEFRHALVADALLADLLPAERAAIARRAAGEVERACPGLPGEWRQLVAVLRQSAGEPEAAARLFADAAEEAWQGGATDSAVALLERALELVGEEGAASGEVRERLVHALADSGRFDQARALAATLPLGGPAALGEDRSAALHLRLARAAVAAGRPADAAEQAALVRTLLTRLDSPGHACALAVVEANLVLAGVADPDDPDDPAPDGPNDPAPDAPGGDSAARTAAAERLARHAAARAEAAGLPEVACQAWQLLSLLERRHGFDRADACLRRLLDLAVRHGLPGWQVDARLRLGVNEFMRAGESVQLERAHRAALDLGALDLVRTAEATLAMHAVLRGDYARARELADRGLAESARLRNVDHHQFLLLTRAAVAAHQGRRVEMAEVLAEFDRWDGAGSLQLPLAHGNCRAVCALLEEDRELALAEFDRARRWEARHPTVFYLNGAYGLHPLLRALTGADSPERHAETAAEHAAGLAWNRQFERLAHAVHLGRAGRAAEAGAAVAEAARAARPFAMARQLGLRLVAEAALADGWGEPVPWLRSAEEYFHRAGVPAVAGACRRLLRGAGASVPQRRGGTERVPAALRERRVTVREYEVLLLVAQRLGNQEIAARLSISPRTVEKHVASLLEKAGRPNRAALEDYAAGVTAP